MITTLTPPTLDLTVVSSMNAISQFLRDNVQIGLVAGTLRPLDVAVVRGRVLSSSGQPLPGVKVELLNELAYGHTVSRGDGAFDLVVNGGRHWVVNIGTGVGYLPVQRTAMVPVGEFTDIGDVMMIEPDPVTTVVDLTGDTPKMAKGSIVDDDDGIRQAVVVVGGNTRAKITKPDGTVQDGVEEVTMRFTEYTVGEDGRERMPGTLPPNVGYTYAVELGVDGAKKVEFVNQGNPNLPPLRLYVDNFIGFPAGETVPVGYYDRDKGIWIASQSGYVIQILDDGLDGCIDLNGNDVCGDDKDVARADELGLSEDESRLLAETYEKGVSLWAVPIRHFSPWDCNWGFGPPDGADDPKDVPDPDAPPVPDKDCPKPGSIIGCRNQSLGQEVPVAGTAHKLVYNSMRVPGYKAESSLNIPLKRTGTTLPDSLLSVELRVRVAGQELNLSWPRNQVPAAYDFTWDGLDVFGRKLQGAQPIMTEIGYTYGGEYKETSRFGYNGSGTVISGDRDLMQLTLWKRWSGTIGAIAAGEYGIGGWTVSEHHLYDPISKRLHKGNGRTISAKDIGSVAKHLAGKTIDGNWCRASYDGPADQIAKWTNTMKAGPDGSLYFVEYHLGRQLIRRIKRDGMLETLFESGSGYYFGAIAVAPNGGVYFSNGSRVWYMEEGAVPKDVAGGSITTPYIDNCGNGEPATNVRLWNIRDLEILADGRLLVSISGGSVVCAMVPGEEGWRSWRFAGTGTPGSEGDGEAATDALIRGVKKLAAASDGSVYMREKWSQSYIRYDTIRKVDTTGIITTVVGGGSYCGGADYVNCILDNKATQHRMAIAGFALLEPEDELFVASEIPYGGSPNDALLMRVDQYQTLRLVSSPVTCKDNPAKVGWCGEGGPMAAASISASADGGDAEPETQLVATSDRTLAISHQCYVWALEAALPGASAGDLVVPDPTGPEVYVFSGDGRHLRTLNAVTGESLRQFAYTDGSLTGISENSLPTTIGSDEGDVIITAPFGQVTRISLDTNGYVKAINVPGNGTYSATHRADGLMSAFMKPDGVSSAYGYETDGRLKQADKIDSTDVNNILSSTLAREAILNGHKVTHSTDLGVSTAYAFVEEPDGRRINTTTFPSELSSSQTTYPDGKAVVSLADGRAVTTTVKPDPQFGMMAPLSTTTTKLPSTAEKTVQHTKVINADGTITEQANGRPSSSPTPAQSPPRPRSPLLPVELLSSRWTTRVDRWRSRQTPVRTPR